MNSINNFNDLVNYFIQIINLIIPILIGLIVIVIVWRLLNAWILNAGDETKVKEGKQTVIVGVMVLVIISGIWGILNLLRGSLFTF